MNKTILVYALISFLFSTGCSRQENKWKEVVQKGTIVSYQEYLKSYPQGKYISFAKDSIANIVCDSVLKTRSIKQLNDFIALYPDNKRINEVRDLVETIDWEKTQKTNNADTVENFIKKYADSRFINDAHLLLNNIYYLETKDNIFIGVSDEDYYENRLLYYYEDRNGTYYRMSDGMSLKVSIDSKNNQATIKIKKGATKESISKLLLSKRIPYLNKNAFIIGNSELIFQDNKLVGMR